MCHQHDPETRATIPAGQRPIQEASVYAQGYRGQVPTLPGHEYLTPSCHKRHLNLVLDEYIAEPDEYVAEPGWAYAQRERDEMLH